MIFRKISLTLFLLTKSLLGHLSGYSEQESALVLQMLSFQKLHGDEKILHLGCRDGSLSQEIATKVPQGHVIGVDNTIDVTLTENNLILTSGDITAHQFHDNFDTIICTQNAEWDQKPVQLMQTIKAALKPGGAFILLLCVKESLPPTNPLFSYSPEFGRNISSKTLHALLKRSSFTQSTCSTKRFCAIYTDPELFKKEAKACFFHTIPPSEQDHYFEQMLQILTQDTQSPYISFPYTIEVGYAIK
jgi:SAM-dependent methyltransferase